MNKKWIQIGYSWGDQEEAIEVHENADAWELTKKLAINEAEAACIDHPEYEIGLRLFPDKNKIALHYLYDDEYCYYIITDNEEYSFIPEEHI